MREIASLIFDMGGVLTQEQRMDKVDELMGLLGFAGGREAFLAVYYENRFDYDRGSADGLAYWSSIAADLGLAPPGSRIPELIRTDLQSWFNMRPAMLELVGGLRSRVKSLVLLSNIHADGARYVRESCPWASVFDELILSCDHLLLKPEAAIYELALRAAGVEASACLFIDDSQANVEGARAVGLSALRFVDEGDFAQRLATEYRLSK